jgi:hypothetical protein
MDVLATVLAPDGRRVDLTRERWAHIVGDHPGGTGHPELRRHRDDVMRARRAAPPRIETAAGWRRGRWCPGATA